jgi:DNA-binding transcriptional LysR family regulator
MLDPRRLQVLRAVAAHGSVSAAAEALFLTQPAVSRQLAKLEQEAGTRLLDRTPRGVRLTAAGAALAERADAIAGQLVAAESEARAFAGLERGVLRVAAFASAAATFVLDAVTAFHRRHPGVELSFREGPLEPSVAALRGGDLDVAVVFRWEEDAGGTLGDLHLVHLFDDPMYVALPHDHRLARRREVRLPDLAEEPWIHGTQPGGLIQRACVAAGFEPRVVGRTDQTQISQSLVAAGLGVTMVPGLTRARGRGDLTFLPLVPRLTRRIDAVSLGGRLRPAAVEAMLALLVRKSARYASEPERKGRAAGSGRAHQRA